MTLIIPKISFADRVLKRLGKKRGVILPPADQEKLGAYTYSTVKKEFFFKALFRPMNKSLPEGMVDINDLISKS